MSARSSRRALERQQKKLARKAAPLTEPNPELLDEFTPEFIAEANDVRERVHRKIALSKAADSAALDSEPRPQEAVRPSEPRATASGVSPAQLSANRQNAKLSCGPRSSGGKETVSFNAFRHGLTGRFKIMPYESEQDYEDLLDGLREEHRPSTPTENLLLDRMAQHYWLAQRALYLQGFCFNDVGGCDHDQHLALYLRYQTTHERAFHKCLNDLLKLRAEKRKEQIGFVSQQHKQADQARREARENRQQERHQWAALVYSSKLAKQQAPTRGAHDRPLPSAGAEKVAA